MQSLARQFVPAADEVGRLQRGSGPECELFRKIAEQGHYAGRTQPTGTRQGIYAATPDGELLASVNTLSAERVARMLEAALERWRALPAERREDAEGVDPDVARAQRTERLYPEDGLVLRVSARDLPRQNPPEGWHALAWNQDYAWFRRDEALGFVPARAVPGGEALVPDAVARRIAALHMIDNVRGQVIPFDADDVREARLATRVTAVEGDVVSLVLEGATRAVARGTWPIDGYNDMSSPTEHERGFEAALLGRATFDRRLQRFLTFELVAIGTRWGGTQYNGRGHDQEPNGMGIAFTLAGENERVAPASIWRYGW